jgi:hypothetical protein
MQRRTKINRFVHIINDDTLFLQSFGEEPICIDSLNKIGFYYGIQNLDTKVVKWLNYPQKVILPNNFTYGFFNYKGKAIIKFRSHNDFDNGDLYFLPVEYKAEFVGLLSPRQCKLAN